MSTDWLASLTVLASAAFFIAKSPKLRRVLSARVKGIGGVAIWANAGICLLVIDLHQASMSFEMTKCSEHQSFASLATSLLNPRLDDDTRIILVPSLAAILLPVILFRRSGCQRSLE